MDFARPSVGVEIRSHVGRKRVKQAQHCLLFTVDRNGYTFISLVWSGNSGRAMGLLRGDQPAPPTLAPQRAHWPGYGDCEDFSNGMVSKCRYFLLQDNDNKVVSERWYAGFFDCVWGFFSVGTLVSRSNE